MRFWTWLKNKFKKPIAQVIPLPKVNLDKKHNQTGEINTQKFLIYVLNSLDISTLKQIKGTRAILDGFKKYQVSDLRHMAYMLATTYHETARTMWPVTEYGSEKYLRSKKYWPYIGRGFVQLTWDYNYKKYGILNAPERALELDMSTFILIDGMTKGIFTGKKLSQYFNDSKTDPINARRIINGTDKAQLIASYYDDFYEALVKSREIAPAPSLA